MSSECLKSINNAVCLYSKRPGLCLPGLYLAATKLKFYPEHLDAHTTEIVLNPHPNTSRWTLPSRWWIGKVCQFVWRCVIFAKLSVSHHNWLLWTVQRNFLTLITFFKSSSGGGKFFLKSSCLKTIHSQTSTFLIIDHD